jgi:hypothetical protein
MQRQFIELSKQEFVPISERAGSNYDACKVQLSMAQSDKSYLFFLTNKLQINSKMLSISISNFLSKIILFSHYQLKDPESTKTIER